MKEEEENNIFDETEEEKESEKSEIKTEENSQEYWRKIVELKKNKVTYNLDPFKYHPNYNAIYKNIPSVKITEPTLKTLPNQKVRENEKTKYKKMEKKKLNPLLITEINNSFSGSRKMKPLKNRNKLIPSKNNHALRFSKYLPRKFNIPENNKNISYINPFNYIIPRNKNKSIDFDKMLHRNENNLVYTSSLKVPSFVQYNPKYNWIDRDKNVRSFNPDEKDKEKAKKYLIRKICSSYEVNTEYQIVDNSKLGKTKFNFKI